MWEGGDALRAAFPALRRWGKRFFQACFPHFLPDLRDFFEEVFVLLLDNVTLWYYISPE
jgi:hypothetical protein